jgi:hypothetical protein
MPFVPTGRRINVCITNLLLLTGHQADDLTFENARNVSERAERRPLTMSSLHRVRDRGRSRSDTGSLDGETRTPRSGMSNHAITGERTRPVPGRSCANLPAQAVS